LLSLLSPIGSTGRSHVRIVESARHNVQQASFLKLVLGSWVPSFFLSISSTKDIRAGFQASCMLYGALEPIPPLWVWMGTLGKCIFWLVSHRICTAATNVRVQTFKRSYIHPFIEVGDALVALARKPAEISACIRVRMRENNKERLSATTLASADGANTISRKAEKQTKEGGQGGRSKKRRAGARNEYKTMLEDLGQA
jgi:hypothetical protein